MSKRTGLAFILFVVIAIGLAVFVMNQQPTASEPVTNTNNTVNTNAADTDTTSEYGDYSLLKAVHPTLIGEITSYQFSDNNSLSVMPATLQSVVLNETPVQSETTITVAGQAGTKYTLSSAKDGSLFTVVQVVYNNQLYDFRGSDDYLANLDQYIQFN